MILAERAARLDAEAVAARARAATSSTDALIAHLKLEIEKLRRVLYGSRSEHKARLRWSYNSRSCKQPRRAEFSTLPSADTGVEILVKENARDREYSPSPCIALQARNTSIRKATAVLLHQPIPDDCHIKVLIPDMTFGPMSGGEINLEFTEFGLIVEGIKFDRVLAHYIGWPNDEVLHAHRLWGRGLTYYAMHEVANSDWLAELELRNSFHIQHIPGIFSSFRHFIGTYKDGTFECIARGLEWAGRKY
ncbi:hypothetical protein Rvan_1781 [Rhodomicrobium vannielii ATCC 17100]|uniref:Uncharacterized protein n=2 Tax=Rhodomicrobium vannielii TaxID=1069 RepID=E3HZJ0_RHOVT|nr:hypothetical protein Rvan_1781 [Rhodomicrobium vannielii ATCC 17100]